MSTSDTTKLASGQIERIFSGRIDQVLRVSSEAGFSYLIDLSPDFSVMAV